MTTQEILDTIFKLPETDRLMIARRLLESLPDPISTDELDDDQFLEELDRRSNDWDGAVSWDELQAQLPDEK